MAVIVECGGGRWLRWQWRLCRRVNDDDRRRRLHPTAASVNNDHSGRRRPSPLPTLTTLTAIAAVNGAVNDDECIRGSRKSPYAYGDYILIPVCIRGLQTCDPRMHTGIKFNPRMHTGIAKIPVCIRWSRSIPVCIRGLHVM